MKIQTLQTELKTIAILLVALALAMSFSSCASDYERGSSNDGHTGHTH